MSRLKHKKLRKLTNIQWWIINQNDFDKQKFEELLIKISVKKDEYFTKKNNLKKLNYQNTWKNVNQKLLEIFNEY